MTGQFQLIKHENEEILKRGNTYFARMNKDIVESELRTAEQLKNLSSVIKQMNNKIINLQFELETVKNKKPKIQMKISQEKQNNNENENFELLNNKINSLNEKLNIFSKLKDDNWFENSKKFSDLEEKLYQFEKTTLERIKSFNKQESITQPVSKSKDIDMLRLFKRESTSKIEELSNKINKFILTKEE